MTHTLHRRPEQPSAAPYNPQYGASIPTGNPWDQRPSGGYQAPTAPQGSFGQAPFAPRPLAQPPLAQQFDFQPPRRNRTVLLLGGGAAAAVIALVVALIVVLATSNDGGSGGRDDTLIQAGDLTSEQSKPSNEPSDQPKSEPQGNAVEEEALQNMMNDFGAAVNTGDPNEWLQYHCSADRAILEKKDLSNLKMPPTESNGDIPLTDITIKGKRATADMYGEQLTFRKEDGDWKICLSDG